METPDRYCEECGAANVREAVICFACSRPLDAPLSRQPQHETHEQAATDDQLAATPVYVQITLAANDTTTIQLVQSQPQPQPIEPLLHERYKVLSQVGTGGFGAVYKARDLRAQGRLVAIKAIELDTLSASQAIEATDTFNRELSLLSNLDHPHLPNIYEHFIDETHWYLVMDFIDGEPLDEYLQQMQLTSLPLKQVLNIGAQLCDVLRYLHQLQPPVIFRDLKPANIMRTPGGRIYLIDFGIARRFKPGQTKDTTPLGSPGFAAPEQYGKAQTTPRSDIYSLGATLYFLLTGYDPANTPFHLPPIRSLCPTLPEPLAELITSMLALDPAARPGNISTVHYALSNYSPSIRPTKVLAQSQVFAAAGHAAAPSAPASPRNWKNFLKGIFSVAMTGLVIAACTLTAHFMGMASSPQPGSGYPTDFNGPANQAPTQPTLFRVPYIGQTVSLNPFTTTDPQAADLENLLFGRLVSLDNDGTALPGIARSWALSSDLLNWTFHLNTNTTFSNGSPITAQDVAASLNYALSQSAAPTNCPFFSLIRDANLLHTHHLSTLLGDSITVLDSQTLTLTTAQPAPYFLATLAAPCGSILKASDLKTWNDKTFLDDFMHVAFSSTYTFTGYTTLSNGMIAFTLNYVHYNNYQLAQPVSAPEQITVQQYPDADASYTDYVAGGLDMSPASDKLPAGSRQLNFAHPLTLHYYGMNYLAKPFDNIAIRQAFALALDKNTLAAISQGTPTNSLLGSWQNRAEQTPIGPDTAQAKAALAQGLTQEGLSNVSQLPPITFFYQAGQPELTSEVKLAQQMWKTVLGITVKLQPRANLNQAIAATRGNASLQFWAADYTPPFLDPYALAGLPFAQNSPLNAVNYGQNSSADAAQQQNLQRYLSPAQHMAEDQLTLLQVYQYGDQTLTAEAAWVPISLVVQLYFITPAFTSPDFSQPFSRAWSPWGSEDYCVSSPPC